MIRKFTNIVCVYYNDKNYIPAKYNCPDLEICNSQPDYKQGTEL